MQHFELDAISLYNAFASGGNEIIRRREEINKINVFPVADGDTGTNLAMTMSSFIGNIMPLPTAGKTMQAIADAALTGARGNSGIIFAQFFAGLSETIKDTETVSSDVFVAAAKNAEQRAREAILVPVEGTILTVMKEWVRLLEENKHLRDIGLIFKHTLKGTKQSVEDTPKLLPVLKKEHVVDAGAEGFFHFLQGATKYLVSGARELESYQEVMHPELFASVHGGEYPVFRYCTEVLIHGSGIDVESLRHDLASFGDCAIVAGSSERARIHVHTDTPVAVVKKISTYGTVQEQKVDDMLREYEISHGRKYPIALVTDSVCDLPANLIDKYQIHVVPLNILVGSEQYFDGLTINNERIYEFMERRGSYPTTAQPGPAVFRKLYSYLSTYYESIIAIHVAGKLSGTYGASKLEAERLTGKKISVIDSRQDSGAQALVVLRAAEMIAAGKSHDEVVAAVEGFIPKARIFVSVPTLKYMVKGGRVSPLKGAIASLLNLKPIVSLDADGGSLLYGKAFSTERNLQKILDLVLDFIGNDGLRCYALVHADMLEEAKEFGRRLESLTGRKPLFIQEISPIIALHAGKGTMAVVLMKE
jgi:uncharacterized protein